LTDSVSCPGFFSAFLSHGLSPFADGEVFPGGEFKNGPVPSSSLLFFAWILFFLTCPSFTLTHYPNPMFFDGLRFIGLLSRIVSTRDSFSHPVAFFSPRASSKFFPPPPLSAPDALFSRSLFYGPRNFFYLSSPKRGSGFFVFCRGGLALYSSAFFLTPFNLPFEPVQEEILELHLQFINLE